MGRIHRPDRSLLRVDRRNPIDWQHPANAGLVFRALALPGLTGGAIYPDLTHRTDASFVGSYTWGPTTRPGGCGQVTLGGSPSDYAAASAVSDALVGLSQASLGCWVYRTPGTVFGLGQGADLNTPAHSRFGLIWYSDNNIYTYSEAGSASTPYATSAAAGWHRLLYVLDTSLSGLARASLYLDGEPLTLTAAGADPAAIASPGAFPWRIGVLQSSSSDFGGHGAWDDQPVWSRALSADEAVWDFEEGRRGYPSLRSLDGRLTMLFGSGAAGEVNLSATGIDSTATVGAATLTRTIGLSATGIDSTATVGTATLTRTIGLSATGIDSTATVGTATLSTSGTVTLSPAGISSTASVGTATLTRTITLSATGISSTATVGTATLSTSGTVTLSPAGISSTASVGTATLTRTITLSATGISSTATVGAATIAGPASGDTTLPQALWSLLTGDSDLESGFGRADWLYRDEESSGGAIPFAVLTNVSETPQWETRGDDGKRPASYDCACIWRFTPPTSTRPRACTPRSSICWSRPTPTRSPSRGAT